MTGVDTSRVGIDQMTARATARGLPVNGVVDDLFTYPLESAYDAIVLDSILVNRELETLKQIRESLSCDLELMANNNCLTGNVICAG